jgi:hypothetical protein
MIKNGFIICFLLYNFVFCLGQSDSKNKKEIPYAQKLHKEQTAEAIKRGIIPDPKVIEQLSGGPKDRDVAVQLYQGYPDNNSSKTQVNSSQEQRDEKVLSEEKNNGVQLYEDYPDLPGNAYDKYEGYINENTLKGGQFSTQELDKMLEESKRTKRNRIIIWISISLFVIFLLFFIKRKLSKNKDLIPIEDGVEHDEFVVIQETSKVESFDFIEKLEQLNNLKEKGAINDSEYEELKKRIINSHFV